MLDIYHITTATISASKLISKTINLGPNVYGLVLTGVYTGIINSGYNPSVISATNITSIQSAVIDGAEYIEVKNDDLLYTTKKSYRYDPITSQFRFHIDNNRNNYQISSIEVGVSIAVLKTNIDYEFFDDIIDGLKYERRLIGVPYVQEILDDVFFAQQKLQDGSFSIENSDGKYDRYTLDNNIYGNPVIIKQWRGSKPSDFSADDLIVIKRGYAGRSSSGRELVFQITDSRRKIDASVLDRKVDLTTWVDAGSEVLIPHAIGIGNRAPAYCLNQENSSATTLYFMVSDGSRHTIQSLDNVYINGNIRSVTPTLLLSADDIYYFEIPASEVEDRSEVSFDYHGFVVDSILLEKPPEIIQMYIKDIYNIDYTDANYDTAVWDASNVSSYPTNIYIDSNVKLQKLSEKLASSTLGYFDIRVDDGRFTFKIYNDDALPVAEIDKVDISDKDYKPVIDKDPARAIAIVRVGYNKRYDKDDSSESAYEWLTDDSKADEIEDSSGIRETKEFPTFITGSIPSQDFSDNILSVYGKVYDTFKANTLSLYKEVVKGDFVTFNLNYDNYYLGWWICQTLEKSPKEDKTDWLFRLVKLDLNKNNPAEDYMETDTTTADFSDSTYQNSGTIVSDDSLRLIR